MTTETEVKNEELSVNVKADAGCVMTLDTKLSPAAAKSLHQKALKTINKEVSIPGFRKGRAPEAVILRNFGTHVDREWRDLIIRKAFEEACALAKVFPFGRESLRKPTLHSCTLEEGAHATFVFEAEPKVPEIQAADLKIEKVEPKPVTEEAIDKTVKDIRVFHADWDTVEGRPVQEGDYVDLTIESLDEPGHTLCKDRRFELAAGHSGAWMIKLLVGKNVGDTVEGQSELDAEQGTEIKNFKPTHCKITIHKISAIKLPEINDELAAKVGVESADQLRDRIREDLNKAAQNEAESKMLEQLDDQLLAAYPFDTPASLFEAERQSRIRAEISSLKKEGKSEDEIKAMESEIEAKAAKDSDAAIRLHFLVRSLTGKYQIQLSQEEVYQELAQQLFGNPNGSYISREMPPEEMHAQIAGKLMREKATATLLAEVLGS
ncbi:MAG: trigger factor [Chlamydiia bacterium]|nr:trigger factor [Chlamydiia bacterium]